MATRKQVQSVVHFRQWDARVEFGTFRDGGIAILLYDLHDGSPIAPGSVWVPGIPTGCVAIKNYAESAGMLEALMNAKVVSHPVGYIQSGPYSLPVCMVIDKNYHPDNK